MSEEARNIEIFNAPLVMPTVEVLVPALPVATRAASILDIIDRAASNPQTNVDMMERLLGMYERIKAGEARAAFKAAQVEMKPKLPVIDKNGKITIKKKDTETVIQSTPYGLYEDIDAAITPILHEHGFVLSFRPGTAPDGKITVTAILSHRLGHEEEATVPLPHDGSGSKNAVQAVGSSLSYGKRYSAILLLNLRIEGEDDDGKAGGDGALLADVQIETLKTMISRGWPSDPGYIEKFCAYLSKLTGTEIAALRDLPVKYYDQAVVALNSAERKKAAK